MKVKELRKKNNKELVEEIRRLKLRLIQIKSKVINKQNPKEAGEIRKIKKTIARIYTILRERGLKL